MSSGPTRRDDARRSTALVEGTEAHYRDAVRYDRTYRRRQEDVHFYVELARRLGGPVLELGVGSGRVAIELARRGVAVVGVDRMASMLARARARRAELSPSARALVELVRGDLRRVRLRRRFPLVIAPFNVFMHLYRRSDVERALETVRAHLAAGGRFVFDVLVPDAAVLARDPERIYKLRPVREYGRTYRYRENFRYDPVRQVQLVTMIFQQEDDPSDFELVPLAHRQFFPEELAALLHYNGFDIVGRYGDFTTEPLDGSHESQVLVTRLSSRRLTRPRRRGPR